MASQPKKKRNKRRVANWLPAQVLIYALLRITVLFANCVPRFLLPTAGRLLGWLIKVAARKQYRIATRNLERSTGIVEPDGIPAFLDRVYANLGSRILDILRLPRAVSRGTIKDSADFRHQERFDEAREQGNGLIVVIGHLGNYESGGVVVGANGHPLNSLARTIPNRFIDRYVTSIRAQTGCKIIPSDKAAREMIAVLKRNEILVIEIDIDAKDDGILVDFCGRPAAMHDVPAKLAIKRSAPIILVEVFQEEGIDVINVLEPIDVEAYRDRPDGVEELTREIARQFDAAVRRHPDEWFWLLDRWRGADRRLEREPAGELAGVRPSPPE
jgi:Kdo2-lipid IVA lauroyltransferase/acyltransferase